MSNAVKYTPDAGKIEISISKNNMSLQVEVKDSGIGIKEAAQDKIFKMFGTAVDNICKINT